MAVKLAKKCRDVLNGLILPIIPILGIDSEILKPANNGDQILAVLVNGLLKRGHDDSPASIISFVAEG
jgi:hypothetical protein